MINKLVLVRWTYNWCWALQFLRLYNFTTGKNDVDPSLNSTYAAFLKTQCKSLSNNITIVPMDPGRPLSFDNTEFGPLMKRMEAIDVLTRSSGEIMKKCNVVNS